MKKAIRKAAGLAAVIAGTVTAGTSWAAMETVMNGKRQTMEESLDWQKQHMDLSWYEPLEKEEYVTRSFDGYTLHLTLCRNPEPGSRYVILTHGYTDTRLGSLKYMKIYLDAGFHCLIYDLRGHGENEKTFCTYSLREAQDLITVINDTYRRYGDNISVGLHGESLGAATSVRALMYAPKVDFVVADCGFADIENVLEGGVSSLHLPKAVVKGASACARLRYGYSFADMRPIDALADNQVPILFLHGAEDRFIPPENSERMKAATAGYAELRLIPGAGHANSVLTDPGLYRQYVTEFLGRLPGNA